MVRLQQASECIHELCKGFDSVPVGTYGGMQCLCGCHISTGNTISVPVNGAGVPLSKLSNPGHGRPKGTSYLHAKHPSSLARKFKAAGLEWQTDFALAIKGNKRERIRLWLRLLPYLITTTNRVRVKKWKGRASRAAMVALDALEGR